MTRKSKFGELSQKNKFFIVLAIIAAVGIIAVTIYLTAGSSKDKPEDTSYDTTQQPNNNIVPVKEIPVTNLTHIEQPNNNILPVVAGNGWNCDPVDEKAVTNLTHREQTFAIRDITMPGIDILLKPLPQSPIKFKIISGAMYQISGTFSYKIVSGDKNTVIAIKPAWWNQILKNNVTPGDIIDTVIDATAAGAPYTSSEKVKAVDASKTIDNITLSQTPTKITFKWLYVFDWSKQILSGQYHYGCFALNFYTNTTGVKFNVTVSDITVTPLN